MKRLFLSSICRWAVGGLPNQTRAPARSAVTEATLFQVCFYGGCVGP